MTEVLKNILMIINPTAGGGRAQHLLPAIQHELGQLGIKHEVYCSDAPGAIRKWLGKKDLHGFDAVCGYGLCSGRRPDRSKAEPDRPCCVHPGSPVADTETVEPLAAN